jgi:ATP-dependent helicase/nuclease subunit A
VVILPDCGPFQGGNRGVRLAREGDGPVFWAPGRDEAAEPVRAALDAAKACEKAERNRLLYVAMTRAESWLIVGASGDMRGDRLATWYGMIEAGLTRLGARPFTVPELEADGLRLEAGAFPHAGPAEPAETRARPAPDLPPWTAEPAAPAPRDVAARSPSDLGGEKVMAPAATGAGEEDALRHGRLVHLMLEHLPELAAPSWRDAATDIAALEAPDLPRDVIDAAFREAERVLTAPQLAHVFAPDTLAEVGLTGQSAALGAPVLGTIDRLIVREDSVTAVDFKTNALVPDRPEAVPEGLLRQMGAYAEMLAAIYPDRRVRTAILWSRTGTLMDLPHDLVTAALARAAAT